LEDELVEEDIGDETIVIGKSNEHATTRAKHDHIRHIRRFSADDYVDPTMARAKTDWNFHSRQNSVEFPEGMKL